MRSRMSVLALAAGLVASSPSPGWALTCTFVADWMWQGQMSTTQGSLIGLVQGLEAALTGSMTMSAELLTSAVGVYTRQVDVNGRRIQMAKLGANQALVSSMMGQERGERAARIQEDYGINTGQGVQACRTVRLMNGVNSVLENSQEGALEAVAALDVAPGSAKPMGESIKLRLDHLDKTDGSLLFDTAASAQNKAIVIAQMAGLPPVKPGSNVSGVQAEVVLQRARRIEALRSPALASLAAVAAMNSRDSHGSLSWPRGLQGEYGAEVSPGEALDALIDRYGGGTSYNEWSAALAGQSERGLLIELTRLRAMSLKLRQPDTEQRARIAVLVAALLSLETGGI